MTRINCIPVTELNDKMLLAEYRELPRISTLIWKRYDDNLKITVHPTPSDEYVLGKGHVIFFYDKGEYLRKRFEEQIVPEMHRRGFVTNFTTYRKHPSGLNKDWVPDDKAKTINRERIQERLKKS